MITQEISLEQFSNQLQYVQDNYSSHGIAADQFDNIVMGGLGGSGIGARFAKHFFYELADKSIEVVSDYNLPNYINSRTLLILGSYSGETEETLSMLEEGIEAGCKMITVCSGGQLQKKSKEKEFVNYALPTGYQPRMAFGFSFAFNLRILADALGMSNADAEIDTAISNFKNVDEWKDQAMEIMNYFKASFKDKFVIFADRAAVPVATRFTQQVQENAKLEGYVNVLPENNHNAMESYYGKLPSNVILLNGNSNDRVDLRFEFKKEILKKNDIPFVSINFDAAVISEIFKTVHILDWLSIYLSNENEVDNMQVLNIDELKNYLSNQK